MSFLQEMPWFSVCRWVILQALVPDRVSHVPSKSPAFCYIDLLPQVVFQRKPFKMDGVDFGRLANRSIQISARHWHVFKDTLNGSSISDHRYYRSQIIDIGSFHFNWRFLLAYLVSYSVSFWMCLFGGPSCFPYILRCQHRKSWDQGICLAGSPYQSPGMKVHSDAKLHPLEQITQIHYTWPPTTRKGTKTNTCRTCKVLNTLYSASNKWSNSQQRYRCCWISTEKDLLSNAEGIQRKQLGSKLGDIQWISNGYPRSCIF